MSNLTECIQAAVTAGHLLDSSARNILQLLARSSSRVDEQSVTELIDAGAEDISLEDDIITVTTAMEDFGSMIKKLEQLKIEPESASLQRIPKTTVSLDIDATRKVLRLVDIIEDDDDVQNVFHTLEISDEIAENL